MPRKAREKSESGIYHIILRGINRQTIFEDDEDRKKFLYTLSRYKKTSGYAIYAYCIMGNHFHLLLKTGAEPLEKVMRRIAGSYVYWYNQKYERIGNLFQDRFKSEPVETDTYLLTVSRYIHQNPQKAGLVKRPVDYIWSSYNDYFNLHGQGLTDTTIILNIFSNNKKTALDQFVKFTNVTNGDDCLETNDRAAKITDDQLSKIIQNKYHQKASRIKNESRDKLKDILREILKIEGVSTRQLARVTGVSLGVIWKLKK
ncbi:MAG: transposase [Bacillota bacterium]